MSWDKYLSLWDSFLDEAKLLVQNNFDENSFKKVSKPKIVNEYYRHLSVPIHYRLLIVIKIILQMITKNGIKCRDW